MGQSAIRAPPALKRRPVSQAAKPPAAPAEAARQDVGSGLQRDPPERATQALQIWLNRASFRMTARVDNPTDHYGRELRMVKRIEPDGSEDRRADYMRDGGWARRYLGGWRGGWC